MIMKTILRFLAGGLLGLWVTVASGASVGNAFNYQGRLESAGRLATGRFDLAFLLYDEDVGGTRYGPIVTNSALLVSNGLFSASLDFGGDVFHGQARWLEIWVRTNGLTAFTPLQPRQPITPTPYALYAMAAASVPSGSILNPMFFGTTAPLPLEVSVNNQRAWLIEPTASAPNLIGGSSMNWVMGGVMGAVIGGGGDLDAIQHVGADYGTVSGGAANQTLDRYATVSGGFDNYASGYASGIAGGMHGTATNDFAVIGGGLGNFVGGASSGVSGGYSNTVLGDYTAVAGGYQHYLDVVASYAFVGGGWQHYLSGYSTVIAGGGYNTATNDYGFIGGGLSNVVGAYVASVAGGQENVADADYAVVGGGLQNWARGPAATVGGGYFNYALDYATVGGGSHNEAIGAYATIGGGANNSAAGSYATVAGGQLSQASQTGAFAAGTGALATNTGAFVWSDYRTNAAGTPFVTSSTATNEFTARATGGFRLITAISGTTGAPSAGVRLTPGSGTWSQLSDRNAKDHFAPVDGKQILAQVAAMPLSTWNYKTQDKSVRHLGPVAQDFAAAFHLGEDDVSIATVDSDGVALAAIQGLNQVVKEKEAEIQALRERLAALEKAVSELGARR